MPTFDPSLIHQVRIPVNVADNPEAKVTVEGLCSPALTGDFVASVAIDPRRAGRQYRYLYSHCIVGPRPCNAVTGACRVDVTTGEVVTWNDLPNAIRSGEWTAVSGLRIEEVI